jgi:cyclic pyranopterin phosphate synthase
VAARRPLSALPDVHDLSLTTNGYLLERQVEQLVAAGLRRVNVSLDSLAPDRFFAMTRRDSLAQVLAGLEAAERYEELRPIKVNAVACAASPRTRSSPSPSSRGASPTRCASSSSCRSTATGDWDPTQVLPNAEVRDLIHAVYPLEPLGRAPSGTARRYRFADGQGEIGFISPVTEPFCGDCNRIRLTADGRLRTCLFSVSETDLREPLRTGASDAELERIIRDAVWHKELKHRVNEPGFVPPARSMSQIGG